MTNGADFRSVDGSQRTFVRRQQALSDTASAFTVIKTTDSGENVNRQTLQTK